MKILRSSIGPALVATVILALVGMAFGFASFRASAAAEVRSETGYAPVAAGTYSLDTAHGVIGFSVRHLGIAWVEGRFKDFTGAINYNADDPTKSTVQFTAKIGSIDTGVAPRDEHLRSADFFDAAKFPEMKFASTKIERKDKNNYVLHGDLTIKGVTKPVAIPFTYTGAVKDPWGGTRFGIEGTAKINRRDFGINFGNTLDGGILDVGNEVNIELHLEAVKAEPKPAA